MITEETVYAALSKVVDPELGINIVDLGRVYDIVMEGERIRVDFTLTYPGCPIGPDMQRAIARVLEEETGFVEVEARLVWQPLWQPELMSEEARVSLGYPI